MALTPLSDDLNIIAALHDEPNVDDGLSAAQLKAKFDESGNKIKTYINGTLKDFVEDLEAGSGLADGAVTHPKLADDAVEENNIKGSAVTRSKLSLELKAAIGAAETAYQKPADGIPASDLADNSVTTAKILNKNVTKAKLEDSVQTSLGKADSAYQKPGTGIPKTDLASAVQTSLGKADTALQSAHEIPAGGTAHQLLVKHSNADYDVAWEEPPQIPSTAADVGAIAAPASPNNYDVLTYYNSEWKAISPRDMDIVVTPNSQPSDGDVIYYDGNDSEWKADTPANAGIHSIPSGGSSGYVLKKASGTDYDVEWAAESGGGGGTSDYDDLTDKPQINSVTLSGNKTTADLGIKEPFYATYGTTTSAEIEAAYQANKAVLCERNEVIYQLCDRATATEHYFSTVYDDEFLYLSCVSNVWNNDSTTPLTSMPSASDVGAVAVSQGVAHAGEFVVVGSDGNITTVTMTAWNGGNY